MGLSDLDLKVSYDSDQDDVLNDFYVPVLSESIEYYRLAGFFSSTVLAAAARGLSKFIINGGKMKLLVGARLLASDVEAIAKGQDLKLTIEKSVIHDLDSIENELMKNHVKALGWMVAINTLQIKVAIPQDRHGLPLDTESVQGRGIFHQKIGILRDSEGDTLSFSGSINESAMGWMHNVEEFKIFRNWKAGEMEHLKSDFTRFERYWYGSTNNMMIVDIPTAIKKKLIEMAPDNFNDLSTKLGFPIPKQEPVLRDYQRKCVDLWLNAGKKGLVEMATGTGKTYVAIACIKEVEKIQDYFVAIIACPFIHLVGQWAENLDHWSYSCLKLFGSSSLWRDILMNKIYDVNSGYQKNLIIVTTHDTFASPQFIEIISRIKVPMMLVGDEVHGMGSTERRKGLLEVYVFRLGLSATPMRYFDEEGSKVLSDFFGDVVFELTLKDAIPDFLTPYEYYPHFVELNSRELEDYNSFSRRIAKQYFAHGKDEEKSKGFELLLIQRQRILVNTQAKYSELNSILDSLGSINNCLVYCSPNQIKKVQQILNSRGIMQHKFTEYENFKERQSILADFASGEYQVLVAMKCLDEGVDVPSTQMAIILASSTNPREFIQRRGRILRKFPGKEKAVIHDLVVIPSFSPNVAEETFEIERKILMKELARIREFASSSMNPIKTLNSIYPILENYKISLEGVV